MRHSTLATLILCMTLTSGLGCDDETDADADADRDTEGDADRDSDASVDADASADADADADADSEPDADEDLDAGVDPAIHRSGRFDLSDPSRPRFSWSGTSIFARFSGTGVSVTLEAAGQNFFEVLIDGEPATVIETTWGEQTFSLASDLPAGEHEVLIVRRTEAFQNAVSFLGFTVEGGEVVASPSPWRHRLEFVGDSITAGYGALGAGPSCPYTTDTESAWVSYASIAARQLGASAHLIAWSGKGVYQNYGGDRVEPMPAIYERTIPTEAGSLWDFSFQAEAVVINLGTNDFSAEVDQALFEAAYRDLILLIRSHHPAAAIYCVGGDFLNETATAYIENAITASGDSRVFLLELPNTLPSEGYGCDWHPSEATHLRLGGVVADRLRSDLGW